MRFLKIAKLASKSDTLKYRQFAKFKNLSSALKEDELLDERLKTSITQHLQSLKTEFKRYFPELKKKQEAAFVRNPFSTALDVIVIFPIIYKTNFMIFKMNRPHVMFFRKRALSRFWCAVLKL